MTAPRFGGRWTRQKLEILRRYLDAYTTALKNQPFQLTYIDAFAGAGAYSTPGDDYKEFNELRRGSTQLALAIDDKQFDRLIFVELVPERVESLRGLRDRHPDRGIVVVQGDANDEIPAFCNSMNWDDRAVVFLDPFKTEVSWSTVAAIAETKKIDCWILFPIMAAARMMPTDREPNEAEKRILDRMFGGREHWYHVYQEQIQLGFFDDEHRMERHRGINQIAASYKTRLEGAFERVARTPRTLINSRNTPLFNLFFAAGNERGAPIAVDIADHILLKDW